MFPFTREMECAIIGKERLFAIMGGIMDKFVLKAPYQPSGDQPEAIDALARGVQSGMASQVLLGVTGSGKTFTMASVIERVQKPTLVIAHNKTLAA